MGSRRRKQSAQAPASIRLGFRRTGGRARAWGQLRPLQNFTTDDKTMNVGIPKERRSFEYRVGLPPAGAALFVRQGHKVYVESGAGQGAGFTDDDYTQSGAQITYSAEEVYGRPGLALKFSRPLLEEIELMRPGPSAGNFAAGGGYVLRRWHVQYRRKITAIAY